MRRLRVWRRGSSDSSRRGCVACYIAIASVFRWCRHALYRQCTCAARTSSAVFICCHAACCCGGAAAETSLSSLVPSLDHLADETRYRRCQSRADAGRSIYQLAPSGRTRRVRDAKGRRSSKLVPFSGPDRAGPKNRLSVRFKFQLPRGRARGAAPSTYMPSFEFEPNRMTPNSTPSVCHEKSVSLHKGAAPFGGGTHVWPGCPR